MPPRRPPFPAVLAFAAALAALPAPAAKQTVCTITVNSADEREAFRAHLPADRFEFVELVERGRGDWLRAACARGVRCDVLLVSGHFAGTEFYSSRPDVNESLRVDEIERAQCSQACPGLFGGLREVYLFGCDSLKPEAVKDHGEASRDVMRRLFAGTPLIYGFSSLAPYGRVAGPMLRKHFAAAGVGEVGGGTPSAALLALFGPSSMVATAGWARTDPNHRSLACGFLDERVPPEGRLEAIAELLAAEPATALRSLERIESFLEAPGDAAAAPAFAAALERVGRDGTRRERFMATVRAVREPALRLRLIEVGRRLQWLTDDGRHAETERLVAELLGSGTLGHGEVDLICRLHRSRALDVLPRGEAAAGTAQWAARACLGEDAARAVMVAALASAEEAEVQLAQAYFRHHPLEEAPELRAAAGRIAGMAPGPAQVRALETLARFPIDDAQTLEALARLFARSASAAIQRAIAEVFVRAPGAPGAGKALADVLRRHRHPAGGREDLIDAAIRRLEAP